MTTRSRSPTNAGRPAPRYERIRSEILRPSRAISGRPGRAIELRPSDTHAAASVHRHRDARGPPCIEDEAGELAVQDAARLLGAEGAIRAAVRHQAEDVPHSL